MATVNKKRLNELRRIEREAQMNLFDADCVVGRKESVMTRWEALQAAMEYADNYTITKDRADGRIEYDIIDDETREAIFWQHYAYLMNQNASEIETFFSTTLKRRVTIPRR